jgi:hypothetical protein
MSSGYGSNYADVIEEDAIRKFCPKEYKNLLKEIKKSDITFEDFAQMVACDDLSDDDKGMSDALEALMNAFETKTGLGLELGYHDSEDNGDKYDDISGAYWNVDGMFQLTPEGKKMDKYVNRKFFVTFG